MSDTQYKDLVSLKNIKDIMKKEKLTSVEIKYSGCGDDGEITDWSAYRGAKLVSDPTGLEGDLYEVIADLHPGYEINEGGYGSITLTLEDGELSVNHSKTDFEPQTLEYAFTV